MSYKITQNQMYFEPLTSINNKILYQKEKINLNFLDLIIDENFNWNEHGNALEET